MKITREPTFYEKSAMKFFGVPFEEVTPEMVREVKDRSRLAKMTGETAGVKLP
jgi:hypothetical protein